MADSGRTFEFGTVGNLLRSPVLADQGSDGLPLAVGDTWAATRGTASMPSHFMGLFRAVTAAAAVASQLPTDGRGATSDDGGDLLGSVTGFNSV